ncbi:CPBP family intramembrane glutamic endopeptidase [Arthrobacter sp. GMC3]|uniref:CPBP family intramembrane glutamic endopeptidase n=1 Tax=Arthrobacter sp. GMC3 TaxID=2058894 RepID=UPI0011B02EE0|nr:type II CAAX endopeptidase family protein [Arthrobacter sp. GMC3]
MIGQSTAPVVERVPRRMWIGLVAIVVYILFAAGLGNALDYWTGISSGPWELVISHAPIVVPIIAGIIFVKWAGWGPAVWRTPVPTGHRGRSWWWLAIPAIMLVQSLVNIAAAPLDTWTIPSIVLVLVVMGLVGLGEEFYFRGILRASMTRHHGETFAFVVTSLAFGLAHSAASLAHGVPIATVAFQVAVTAAGGAVLYGAFLATGRLWVPIALHALDDFSLALGSGGFGVAAGTEFPTPSFVVFTQAVLWILAVVVLISCIRRDHKAKRAPAYAG